MFPDSPTYKSVIFARSDSTVSLLSDLNPVNSIALGDYFSTFKFYAPLYRLYGLSLKVELDKKPKEIYKSVISGKVTLGVAANDPEYFKSNDPKIKIIPDNGQLPSSTVSLSPNLNENDRKVLKDVLLNAPKKFRDIDHANFGKVTDKYLPNYEEFSLEISISKLL
jgi:ABC-type phosphate/phosphonate transport system substrate-binding protein